MASERHYRNALVTGASSGIGRELARGLAARGTRVVVAARRLPLLEELMEEIRRDGGEAQAEAMDVADTEAVVQRVRAIDEAWPLDLVIANAGVGVADRRAPSYAWEAIGPALHTNFCGAAVTLTAALPRFVERGTGHLAALGSLASFGPLPEAEAYCSPKAGLDMLMECLRLDLRGTGVAVTMVHAGFVRTAMIAESTHPMPMTMSPEDAAEHILHELPKAPATISFPAPMAAAAWMGGHLPRALRSLIFRR